MKMKGYNKIISFYLMLMYLNVKHFYPNNSYPLNHYIRGIAFLLGMVPILALYYIYI